MQHELKCYQVIDGEVHYIAACNLQEAQDIYAREVNTDDGAVANARFTELSRVDMAKIKVRMTIADLFDDHDEPGIVAGTID